MALHGRHYHVIDILDRKIILARHGPTSQQVIFKVLQKSAGQQEYSENEYLILKNNFKQQSL